jgi:ABC-type enterochelin transport system permease subunit
MTDIRANNRILLAFVAAFILNKVILRPYVISNDVVFSVVGLGLVLWYFLIKKPKYTV